MNKIDMNKKYRTCSGNKVTVLTVSAKHPTHPVIALVDVGDREVCVEYTLQGKVISSDMAADLVEVEETVWLNIYPRETYKGFVGNPYAFAYDTKEEADFAASDNRVACVEVPIPRR